MRIIAFCILTQCVTLAMEKKEDAKSIKWCIPKDICNLVAEVLEKNRFGHEFFDELRQSTYCLSENWNNLEVKNHMLLQKCAKIRTPSGEKKIYFYDADIKEHGEISYGTRFDGPNHDRVIALFDRFAYYNFFSRRSYTTSACLNYIKLDDCASGHQIIGEVDQPFKEIVMDDCDQITAIALAKRKLLAIGGNKIQIFNYQYSSQHNSIQHDLVAIKKLIGHSSLKKLAWIYGRALIGLQDNYCDRKFFFIVPDYEKKDIKFYPCKIPMRITNFAIHQPDKQHEVVLCDDKDNIYFASLHDKTDEGKIRYRKILNNGLKGNIDHLWFYDGTICTMDRQTGEANFFDLCSTQNYNPEIVNAVIENLLVLSKQRSDG